MATVTERATKAVRDFTEPVNAVVEENMRDVRRAVVAGRHALEDCSDDATIQIRRYPFMSVGVAVGVGTVLGLMIGLALGCSRRRT